MGARPTHDWDDTDWHVLAQDISHCWSNKEEVAVAYQAAGEAIRICRPLASNSRALYDILHAIVHSGHAISLPLKQEALSALAQARGEVSVHTLEGGL
jgi:hypothetical protein